MQQLAAASRVPDLVISDYRLRDGENGIGVIENVRHEFNADIPALPILHKPLNPAKLRTLMASLLRNRFPI